jgi:hypothetical protein
VTEGDGDEKPPTQCVGKKVTAIVDKEPVSVGKKKRSSFLFFWGSGFLYFRVSSKKQTRNEN